MHGSGSRIETISLSINPNNGMRIGQVVFWEPIGKTLEDRLRAFYARSLDFRTISDADMPDQAGMELEARLLKHGDSSRGRRLKGQ